MFFFNKKIDKNEKYRLTKKYKRNDVRNLKNLEHFEKDFNFIAGNDNIFGYYNKRAKIGRGVKSKYVNSKPDLENDLKKTFFKMKRNKRSFFKSGWIDSYDFYDERELFFGYPSLDDWMVLNQIKRITDLIFDKRTYTDFSRRSFRPYTKYGYLYKIRIKELGRALYRGLTFKDSIESINYIRIHNDVDWAYMRYCFLVCEKINLPLMFYWYREPLIKIKKTFRNLLDPNPNLISILNKDYQIDYDVLKKNIANDIRYKLLGCFFHTELNNILIKPFDLTSRINKSTNFKYSITGKMRMKYFLHNQIQYLPLSARTKFILLKNKDTFLNTFDIANPKLAMNKTTNRLSIDTRSRSLRNEPKGSFSIFQYRVNTSLPSNTSLTVGNPLLFLETEYNKFRGSLFNYSFIDKPRRLVKQDVIFPNMRKLPILKKYIPSFFWDLNTNISFIIKQKLYDFTMYSKVNNNLPRIQVIFFKKTEKLFMALNNFIGPEESVIFGKTQHLKLINKIIYKFFYYTNLIKLPYGGNIETNHLLENRSIHTSYLESKLRKTDIMFPYYNKDESYMNMVTSLNELKGLRTFDIIQLFKYVPGRNRNEFFDYIIRNDVLSISGDYGSKYIYNGYSITRNFPMPFNKDKNRELINTFSKLDYVAKGDKRFVHRIPLNTFSLTRKNTKELNVDSIKVKKTDYLIDNQLDYLLSKEYNHRDIRRELALDKVRNKGFHLYLLKSGSENDNLKEAFINNTKNYFRMNRDLSRPLLKNYFDKFFSFSLPENKYFKELIQYMCFFDIKNHFNLSFPTKRVRDINNPNVGDLFLHSYSDTKDYYEYLVQITKDKYRPKDFGTGINKTFIQTLSEKIKDKAFIETLSDKIKDKEYGPGGNKILKKGFFQPQKVKDKANSLKQQRRRKYDYQINSSDKRDKIIAYRNILFKKWYTKGRGKLKKGIFYREEEMEPYSNLRMVGGDRVRKYSFKDLSTILKLEKKNKRPQLFYNYHNKNDINLFDSYRMNSLYDYNKKNVSFLTDFFYIPFYGIDEKIRTREEGRDLSVFGITYPTILNKPIGKKEGFDIDHIFKNFVFSFKYFTGPKTSSTISINNYRINLKNNLHTSENKSYRNTNIINNYLPFYNYSTDIIHKGFDIFKLDLNIQMYLFGFNLNPFIIIYLLIFFLFVSLTFNLLIQIKKTFNKNIYTLSSNYKKEIIHNINNEYSHIQNNERYADYKKKIFYKTSAHREKERWTNKYIDPIISFFYFFISTYLFTHFLKDIYFPSINSILHYFVKKVDFFLMSYKNSVLHLVNNKIYDYTAVLLHNIIKQLKLRKIYYFFSSSSPTYNRRGVPKLMLSKKIEDNTRYTFVKKDGRNYYSRNLFFIDEDPYYHQPIFSTAYNPSTFFFENEMYTFLFFICFVSFIISLLFYRKSKLKQEVSIIKDKKVMMNKEFVFFIFFLNVPILLFMFSIIYSSSIMVFFVVLIFFFLFNIIYIFVYLNILLKFDIDLEFLDTELEKHFLLLNDKLSRERDKQTKQYYYNIRNKIYSSTEKKIDLRLRYDIDKFLGKLTSHTNMIDKEKNFHNKRKKRKNVYKKPIKIFFFLVFYIFNLIISIIILSHVFIIKSCINLKKNISIAIFDLQFNIHRYIIKGTKLSMSEIIMQMDYGDKLIQNCKEVSKRIKLKDYYEINKSIVFYKDIFSLKEKKITPIPIFRFIKAFIKAPYDLIEFFYNVFLDAENIMTFRLFKESQKIGSLFEEVRYEQHMDARYTNKNSYEYNITRFDFDRNHLLDELMEEGMVYRLDSGHELNDKYNVHLGVNSVNTFVELESRDDIAVQLNMSTSIQRLRYILTKDTPYDYTIDLAYKNLEERYYNKGNEDKLRNETDK